MTTLVGSVIIAQILNAALAREKLAPTKRKQFNLYVDEFQRFATKDLAVLLTEARKYGIATTIAHQARYQEGMNQENRVASLTASNLMVFRVSDADAKELFGNFDTRPIAQPPEEATRRKKQTPITDVVGWLLSNRGGHDNPVVNQFAMNSLRKLNADRQGRDSQIDTHLYQLNLLLREAMVNKRFDTPLPIETLKYFQRVLGNYRTGYSLLIEYKPPRPYVEPIGGNFSPWDYNIIVRGVNVLWTEQPGSSLWQQWVNYLDRTQRTYIREWKLGRLAYELWKIGSTYYEAHNAACRRWVSDCLLYHESRDKVSYLHLRTPPHDTLAWLQATWQPHYPDEKWYDIKFNPLDIEGVYKPNELEDDTHIKEGQGGKFYNPVDLDRAVEAELQEQKTIFLNFLWELKQVM